MHCTNCGGRGCFDYVGMKCDSSYRAFWVCRRCGLDSALAALIAYQVAEGGAHRVGCGHDTSAIWLPAPPKQEGPPGDPDGPP